MKSKRGLKCPASKANGCAVLKIERVSTSSREFCDQGFVLYLKPAHPAVITVLAHFASDQTAVGVKPIREHLSALAEMRWHGQLIAQPKFVQRPLRKHVFLGTTSCKIGTAKNAGHTEFVAEQRSERRRERLKTMDNMQDPKRIPNSPSARLAGSVVGAVLAELKRCRGFDHWWKCMPESNQEDIITRSKAAVVLAIHLDGDFPQNVRAHWRGTSDVRNVN